ncbi:uncharacterized protein Gasu_34810 [Galdieria sulphuraria]|uniref:Uncharacterized protein n=1 Tax=Galdieria sulphuraria TaxID=130081 RepID=M2WYF4_GALSU|nr:uncharacterized protein Gasu_34810 [Galdieria sulphuraria]EME29090.1 hypothetical protein Gasu_34810 [Galdieria sulphuraria]|eukprot:XP_005705610.1 hypothetical protein Gasu_34810 [Galdieria sulphuraria]
MWIQRKPNYSSAMITAVPLTNMGIQNMISAFTTCLALETQWKLQTNLFAIKLPGIRINMPKLPLPQIKGNKGQQSKDAGSLYVDDNPNSGLFTKATAPRKTNPSSTSSTSSQVRVRAAGSPVKVPQAPTLDEIRQRKGIETTVTGNEGWKRFPSRRRPGKDMDMFLNMSKDMKRGS